MLSPESILFTVQTVAVTEVICTSGCKDPGPSFVPMNAHGASSLCEVGHTKTSPQQIIDNWRKLNVLHPGSFRTFGYLRGCYWYTIFAEF